VVTAKKLVLSMTLGVSGMLLSGGSFATTVLNIPGPTFGFFDFADAALADSWTQSFNLSDGSISVTVQGLEPSGGAINFYLTTAVGPSATLGNLVAFNSIQAPFAVTTVTPFQNLNLGPGTYYLIMADYTPNNTGLDGPDWNYRADYNLAGTQIQTVPGLTLNPMEEASALGPYAPATTFEPVTLSALQGVMTVTGTVTPVPLPSTWALFSAAVLALGIVGTKANSGYSLVFRLELLASMKALMSSAMPRSRSHCSL
jgi:hypothetical protein